MAPGSPWPGWFRYTASAAVGAGAVLVPMILSYGDTKKNAAEAKAACDVNLPKVTILETKMFTVEKDISEMKADIKELLRRVK